MLAQDLIPRCTRHDSHVLQDYEVPHRIYDASIYPLKSPNGSQILLFGHQQGLTVIWKGGSLTVNTKINTNEENVNDLSPDHEEEAEKDSQMRDRDFDDIHVRENQSRSSNSVDHVVDVYNFSSDSPVVHIAFAPIPSKKTSHVTNSVPPLFSKCMVVALGHLDGSLRLMALPLLPPALTPNHDETHANKTSAFPGVTIRSKRSAIQQKWRGLALTWTSPSCTILNEGKNDLQWRNGNAENSQEQASNKLRNWSLVVAAHNAEAAGFLSIYEVPLLNGGNSLYHNGQDFKPCQREHLPGLVNAMSFSPARFPSRRHSQLLVADIKGSVRIYDYCPSATYLPIPATQDQEANQLPGKGAWLSTFYTNYINTEDDPLLQPRRKRILDVRWSLNGHCITALLEDGEWGIWDLEGAGPTPLKCLKATKSAEQPITLNGGGVTSFALHGFVGIGGGNATRHGSLSQPFREGLPQDRGKLAPMTPNTRRAKQKNLFAEKTQSEPSKVRPKGGISISQVTASVEACTASDESLLIWFGSSVFYTPSLLSYWQKAVNRSGGPAGSGRTGDIIGPTLSRLGFLSTLGEHITTVSQPTRREKTVVRSAEPEHDILVVAEHRFLVLSPLTSDPRSTSEPEIFPGSGQMHDGVQTSRLLEQDLLSRGELSLGGLNRLLDGLDRQKLSSTSISSRPVQRSGHGKMVGFAAGN